MATDFETAHGDGIVGTLTTVDRLIIHGHLRGFWCREAWVKFFYRQGLTFRDFGRTVQGATERLKTHARAIADKAGRPFLYQDRVIRRKDELARQIAKRDGISEGLICVFSTLELATCFAFCKGAIFPRQRKCLHLYFYLIDRDLGFMHVRLQTWFPFQIQIWINGREWLARQLDGHRIGYRRYENTFIQIDDLDAAKKLAARFPDRSWCRVFDAFARRVNPLLRLIVDLGLGSYYWAVDDCEIATDVMWRNRAGLLAVRDDLFDHAMRAFSSEDVVRFLGQKLLPYKNEVESRHRQERRPDCRRIKHRLRGNWIKMYDKWSVLRVETVINNPLDFRVLRFEPTKRGKTRGRWMRMGKGIQNLWRYLEVGEAANRRYLDALAAVRPTGQAVAELDDLCRGGILHGRRCPKLNPVSESDCRLFRAVMAGEHAISGFRNRNLQPWLYAVPARFPEEARARCARVSRLISKLRGHRLVAKVRNSRLYRVTPRGHRVMSAALLFRQVHFPNAIAA